MNYFAPRIWLSISSLQFSLWFNANLFPVCIAVNCARQSFVLMKETRNHLLDFQVEALIISRRNILEQLICVPRRGWQSFIRDDPLREGAGSRLSEMILFEKAGITCKVSDPSFANFNQRRSGFLVATSPLPIFIKEDPASWWQNLPLSEGLRPCAGGRPLVSSWDGLSPWK